MFILKDFFFHNIFIKVLLSWTFFLSQEYVSPVGHSLLSSESISDSVSYYSISLYRLFSLTFAIPSCPVFPLLSLIIILTFIFPAKHFPSSISHISMSCHILLSYYLFPPNYFSLQYNFLSRITFPIRLFYFSTYCPFSVPLQSISLLMRNFLVRKFSFKVLILLRVFPFSVFSLHEHFQI